MSSGVVYDQANPPSDQVYKLDDRALASITSQLVGVPVRIEHEPARNVGRVTAARLDGGRLVVDWELEDSASGWSSARFIEKGITPELSLQHALFGDGTVKPIEVSIVRKGARAGCAIATEQYKHSLQNGGISVMASAAAPPVDLSPPAQNENAPPNEAPPPPAAAAAAETTSEAPPAKRAKHYETPMDFVNDIKDKVGDADTLQTILNYFAENMDNHVKTQQEVSALRQAKELLEQSQKAHVESSKNVVRDIVDCLSAIYQNYGSVNMEQPHKEKLTSLLSDNVEAREALRPLLVAASAMSNLRAAAATAGSNAAVEAASKKIAELSEKLTAARRLTAHAPVAQVSAPAVAPQWTAAPVVEIAASAAHAAPARPEHTFVIPDILKTVPFNVGGVGRVSRTDFTRKM